MSVSDLMSKWLNEYAKARGKNAIAELAIKTGLSTHWLVKVKRNNESSPKPKFENAYKLAIAMGRGDEFKKLFDQDKLNIA
jgi:hypothetical protein